MQTADRQAWLEARRHVLGATDISAITGLNPYCTPLQTYMDKMGLLDDQEPTSAMKRGLRLEPYVAALYQEQTGAEVVKAEMVRHPTKDYLAASPDYEDLTRIAWVEIKTHIHYVRHEYGEPGSGEIPVWEAAQVQWQMRMSHRPRCYVAVLFGVTDEDFAIYDVPYDEEAGAMLEARADAFWRDNILAQVPPYVAAADSDLLKRLFPFDRGATVYATPEIEEHCRALGPATEAVKAATLAKDAHVAAIQQHMGDAAYLEWSGGKPFSWRTGKGSPRYKDLAEYLGATAQQVEQFRGSPKRTFLSPWSRG